MSERRNCVWVVEVRRKGYFFAWKIASEGYDKRSMPSICTNHARMYARILHECTRSPCTNCPKPYIGWGIRAFVRWLFVRIARYRPVTPNFTY